LELAAADAWEAHPAEIPVSDRNSIPPTQFLYDGLDIAQQLEAQRTSSYLRSLSIDETLGLTNLDGSFFLTADARGSTGAVTDATGTAVTEYTYDSFGSVSATNPAFATTTGRGTTTPPCSASSRRTRSASSAEIPTYMPMFSIVLPGISILWGW